MQLGQSSPDQTGRTSARQARGRAGLHAGNPLPATSSAAPRDSLLKPSLPSQQGGAQQVRPTLVSVSTFRKRSHHATAPGSRRPAQQLTHARAFETCRGLNSATLAACDELRTTENHRAINISGGSLHHPPLRRESHSPHHACATNTRLMNRLRENALPIRRYAFDEVTDFASRHPALMRRSDGSAAHPAHAATSR